MTDDEQLRAHAERIRASGILGRSPQMLRLFDFLLKCTLAGKAPKEIEVAMDAFGKDAGFDAGQDASVRVYIHKLRRKLEEFYAGPGSKEPMRLGLPKGEYRFAIEEVPSAERDAVETAQATPPHSRRQWLVLALGVSFMVIAAAVVLLYVWPKGVHDDYESIRASAVWAPLFDDDRPIFVVVGDYYIFGETDDSLETRRLIREFDINSPRDLRERQELNPELAERYRDLELSYLPTSAADALRNVIPLLSPANRRVRVVAMSQLDPSLLKNAHIVYVGLLSGLGVLRDLVFRGSRLSVGGSFDELVDRVSGQRYISQAAAPMRNEPQFRDYGYFTMFSGPNGNRILVIAGMRDMAATHMAETMTSAPALATLATHARSKTGFEALYEVYGMEKVDLSGRMLVVADRDTSNEQAATTATQADSSNKPGG